MNTSGHLASDLLIRMIDDEVEEADRLIMQAHLSVCADCESRYRGLAVLSVRLESWAAAIPADATAASRNALEKRMETVANGATDKRPLVSWRLGWGMAIAASLALGLVILPYRHTANTRTDGAAKNLSAGAAAPGTLEIEGETFVSLPYSNSDLPLSAPRIVRMRMPLSSLADAGLVFEPVSTEAGRSDRSVLADVLLGADGEPMGVHVVTSE